MTQSIYFFKLKSACWQFQTIKVSECGLIILLPYILFEKYINILALEMASPGNQHRANCIGTFSFHIGGGVTNNTQQMNSLSFNIL